MVRLNIFALVPFALGATAAVLDIPSVDAAVAAALKGYGNYEAYSGPQKKPPPQANVSNLKQTKVALDDSSYWLDYLYV
ncbi:uncharacterized protein N7500_000990 [Penicillium coprophilum]|uniref:uncharacterized protein n=1 Tax=Penicillium coprophilum TaxID=36646 RepID=UPI002382713F|nr:uncharacterized protein N7500_000990 [Penicillium coprophilum]KAJ5178291.1 hypothetical protein N7500_000990 [Penicillium coprophilum]